VLGTLAAVVIAYGRDAGGAGTVGWLFEASIAERVYVASAAVILAVLVLETWLLISLLAQNGRLALRLDALEQAARTLTSEPQGLAPGTSAPAFTLPDTEGKIHTLEGLRAAGTPVVLLFIDPDCGPCNALLPEAAGWQRQTDHFLLASISRGALDRNRASARQHGLSRVLIQHDDEVMQTYRVSATPTVVVVNSAGVIADVPAVGDVAIRGVLARLLTEKTPRSARLAAPERAAHEDSRDRTSAAADPVRNREHIVQPTRT
jgi:peroxiredoxin